MRGRVVVVEKHLLKQILNTLECSPLNPPNAEKAAIRISASASHIKHADRFCVSIAGTPQPNYRRRVEQPLQHLTAITGATIGNQLAVLYGETRIVFENISVNTVVIVYPELVPAG